ncbi:MULTISPECIES: helix-turn-helix domain-containing protein [unclassified Clostridium]|uniref:helix-turn-helix transcriptional regulator n=1 Tax=unclassified Clostridium TaxID=2614128 RepID=UPI000297CC2B|nr:MULTISPECIES: helix-turn-helix domain-containing protein [unclassified Clostridium]EKQ56407.1 MAG: putative transcriptional regulator [Clostridium sp. Maddingley MBC34-26]
MGVKNRLKEIRMREYLMAPGEFAKLLGMSIKTYSGWENEYSRPTLEKALEVSKKLNKDVNEIWYLE